MEHGSVTFRPLRKSRQTERQRDGQTGSQGSYASNKLVTYYNNETKVRTYGHVEKVEVALRLRC